MALVNNGTLITVSDAPAGFTAQVSTPFNDWQYKYGASFDIATSTVSDPNAVTTFTALETAIQALVDAKLADFEAVSGTPTAYALWKTATITTGSKYGQDVENYTCSVDIYVKTLL